MKEENNNSLKGLSGGGEEAGPLFSIFRPAPAPAPAPPTVSAPAPVPVPPPAKIPEPAPVPAPPPASQDREMIDYLKARMTEMESKLRESQEKGLAFAYELKGREEARKESRREMEEFLNAVKRQQAESETERSRGLELEKARSRIEALELKIMEFSALRPELPAGEIEKLRAGLKEELAADFALLSAKLAEKISKEIVEPLARGLDAENSARGKDNEALRLLGEGLAAQSSSLESAFSKKLSELEALFAGFYPQLKAAQEDAGKGNDSLRLLGDNLAAQVSSLESAFSRKFSELQAAQEDARKGDEELRALVGTCLENISKSVEESRSGLLAVEASVKASRVDVPGLLEGLKLALQAEGAKAADAAARGLAGTSGLYDLGFITACFDNLEKAFSAAAETLARADADARRSAGSPGAEAALIAGRHAAILDAAARDLLSALEVFRGVRREALAPIKKILGA